jgi:inorganic pyrophosphatase
MTCEGPAYDGPAFDDYHSTSGQSDDYALSRMADRLRERRGPATGLTASQVGTRVCIFIEVEAGSDLRHVYDEATFELLSTRKMTRPYPFPYGFIVGTTNADGGAVDCYVLTQRPIPAGTLVEGEPAGLLEQFEDGEVDHKVLATIPGEDEPPRADLDGILTDFIAALFRPYPMIHLEVGRILDANEAAAFIAARRGAATG